MATLYLCAAGNPEGVRLAQRVNAETGQWSRIVLLDDAPEKLGKEVMGVPVVGGFDILAQHQSGDGAVNLVARSTAGRDGARRKIESFGIPLVSLIDPSVDLDGATVGQAVTLYAGCVVSALSHVGDHSVIFTQAVLGHGATLGAGAVLAPGAVVNARVQVGAQAYVGANGTVLPDLTVGAGATVSACSALVGDLPEGAVALGVPAEILGGREEAAVAVLDRGQTEAAVLSAYAQVLQMASVRKGDNFFDFGGTSKRAVELQVALKAALDVPVSLVDLFRFPSAGALIDHLCDGREAKAGGSRAALLRRRRSAHV